MTRTIALSKTTGDIPPATLSRAGDVVVASNVSGIELKTGNLPADTGMEYRRAFDNLRVLCREAGLGLNEIGLINVWIPDRSFRTHIDPAWDISFPESPRPARKTNEAPLPGGCSVLLQAYAHDGIASSEVNVDVLAHRSPIPPAARCGAWVFSSVTGGNDPESGAYAEEPEVQIRQAFDNMRLLMEAAGGGLGGVNHLWVFLADMGQSDAMLRTYLELFPDEGNRPARKTVKYALPAELQLQLQFTGSINGTRRNFEVPGVGHHDPIPLASSIDGLLQSSGIHGIDPATSRIVDGDVGLETETALDNVSALMEVAGGSVDAIAGLTVLLRNAEDLPIVRDAVNARFTPGDAPSLQICHFELPHDLRVQFHVTATAAS